MRSVSVMASLPRPRPTLRTSMPRPWLALSPPTGLARSVGRFRLHLASCLSPAERGGALFEEGGNAFRAVRRVAGQLLQLPLKIELSRQRVAARSRKRPFAQRQAVGGGSGKQICQRIHFRAQLVVIDHLPNQ